MGDELPTDFDLIVVGTGLTESIIAAAASRVGKSVLHIDTNDFYGGHWASFNLESIQSLSDTPGLQPNALEGHMIRVNDCYYRIKNVSQKWSENLINNHSAQEEEISVKSETCSKELALKEFRKFNIDITPKLLFANGELVKLLISSNICRYAEFRSVDRVLTIMDDQLRLVPCTRADVFSSAEVTNVERRLLMKHTMSCINFSEDSNEFQSYASKTFSEYLTDKKLTPKLKHLVLVAIAMANEQTPCFEGVRAVQTFLESASKYGDTPFLFPMYGCGEIPQCFCRLCAVFGGVYCLKQNISEIHFTTNGDGASCFEAISCGKQKIHSKNIIFGHETMNGTIFPQGTTEEKHVSNACGNLSRCILISKRSFGSETLNSGGGGVMFLKLPGTSSSDQNNGAYVIQLSHFSGTCPKNFYIIHVTCQSPPGSSSPEEDLEPYVNRLLPFFNEPKSPVIWSMFFTIPSCQACNGTAESPYTGVHLSCGPFFELDYDLSIQKAKDIFAKIYPNEEFLPRAPDPEEIVVEDDDTIPESNKDANNA